MLTGLTSGTAPFRPRARLIHLLGDELISDEVMAAVELVKNAYDADARTVTVALFRQGKPDAAYLEIRDDGEGMDLDTLLHAWLEPATEFKRRGGRKRRTALGRYPLGEKGVGRFAADKLGAELELITRTRHSAQELWLHVRWDLYGDGGYIDQIENHWALREPREFPGALHGTLLRITRLRTAWDAGRLTRLRVGLSRLVSPFSQHSDFQIVLECPDFPELTGPVTNSLLEHAPYRLIGQIDAQGVLHTPHPPGESVDLRLAAPEHFATAQGFRLPCCGPFRVALFVWDLDSVSLGRAAMDRTMRQALKRFCGVSIYRDGFRVWPYGSPGDDWLELNQRRVNNPTVRVSTNQIVGIVEITQEHNPDLRDRTSREGLIDTPALHDLKALVLAAISWLEERRFAARQGVSRPEPDGDEPDPILRMIRDLRTRAPSGRGTIQVLDRLAAAYRRQLRDWEAREGHLMRLAGIGLAAEQVIAEITRVVSVASTQLRIARNLADHGGTHGEIVRCLEQLEGHIGLLGEQLDALEPLYAPHTPAEEPLDVRSVVQHAARILATHLHRDGIHLVTEAPTSLTIRMARAHLLQVLLHLFDNALYWSRHAAPLRRPEIHIRLFTDPPGLLFADNGPGVRAELREHIFRPFFSSRSDGRGLGLYFARAILERYGFSIELLDRPELLQGANFRLAFGGPSG
jgi:signal transduction histidine kinase